MILTRGTLAKLSALTDKQNWFKSYLHLMHELSDTHQSDQFSFHEIYEQKIYQGVPVNTITSGPSASYHQLNWQGHISSCFRMIIGFRYVF